MGLALTLAGLLVIGTVATVVVVWLAFTNVTLAVLAAGFFGALLLAGVILVARAAGSPTRPPK